MATVLGLALLAAPAFADDASRAKAKEVFEKNKDAVVWVSATVKLEATAGGRTQNQEAKVQALGTVVDPSGLVVVSFSKIDPAVNANGSKLNVGGQVVTVSAKSEFVDVKINTPEGKEVNAKIVLTDPDMDLAFVKPTDDQKLNMKSISLDKTPKVEVLDEIVFPGRMEKQLDQTPAVAVGEVSSIVKSPTTLYITGKFLGGPVLAMDGTCIGITVAYHMEVNGNMTQTMATVPAAEVLKGAKLAITKKAQASIQPASTQPASAPADKPAEPSKADEAKKEPAKGNTETPK